MITDLSPNNHTFTEVGSPILEETNGPHGNPVYWYDGASSFEISDFTKLPEFTISFWVSIDSPPQGYNVGNVGFPHYRAGIVYYSSGYDGWGMYVHTVNSTYQVFKTSISSPPISRYEQTILDYDAAAPGWYYITTTYNNQGSGGTLTSYVNGQQVIQNSHYIVNSNQQTPTNLLSIGNYGDNTGENYIGYISEVLILNKELNSIEVTNIYNSQLSNGETLTEVGLNNLPFAASNVELWTKEEVDDITGPVITLNGGNTITIEQNSTWNDPGATALDAVDGAVSVSIFPEYIDTSIIGPETISYIASDNTGNETIIYRELIIEAPVAFDKGDKPPLLNSDFIINTHKLVNHESSTASQRAVPFAGSSKTSSNIRKAENIYSREDKNIREIKEALKLKDRQPEIYKRKHKLTESTINSKHTKVKLQEAIKNKNIKIVYNDIVGDLGSTYSTSLLSEFSEELERLDYLLDSKTIREDIRDAIVEGDGIAPFEDISAIESIVLNARSNN